MKYICMFSIGDLLTEQTGGKKRFLELYKYFKKKGYKVDLYCGTAQEILEKQDIKGYSLNINENTGIVKIPAFNIFKNNRKVYEQIKTKNYDYIISFDVPSTIGLCLHNIKNICFFIRQDFLKYRLIQYQSLNINKFKINIYIMIGWIMESICLIKSKQIILQCKYDLTGLLKRHFILKKCILKKSKIQINNINPSWVVSHESINNLRKEYDLIYVGNFTDTRKGYDIILKALDILYKKNIHLKSILIGDGIFLNECKKKYKYNKNLIFKGYVKNPSEMIKKSTIMVVPSYADSCPNTVLEALYLRTPVIGANTSGIPEILNNSEWVFDLNPYCLSSKISSILNENNIAKVKEDQLKRRQELYFDWCKKIHDLLEMESENTIE